MKKIFGILAVLSLLMVPFVSMAATMSDADLAAVTGAGVEIDISPLTIGLSLDSITWGDYNVIGFTTTAVGGAVTTYNSGGNINILPLPGTMHVLANGIGTLTQGFYNVISATAGSDGSLGYDTASVADLLVDINVGTTGGSGLYGPTGKYSNTGGTSAIQLGFVNGVHVALDGFVADIVLDATNAAFIDWQSYTTTPYIPKYNAEAGFNNIASDGTMGTGGTLAAKSLGIFGIAGLVANVTGQNTPANPGVPVAVIPFYVTITAH